MCEIPKRKEAKYGTIQKQIQDKKYGTEISRIILEIYKT
jgi:hypothetical protein